MKTLTYKSSTLIIILLISASSCKKFVQIPAPKNQLISSTVFADSVGANAAINGLYINMMSNFTFAFANGAITLYTGLSGDELYESINNPSDAEFYNNAIKINNDIDGQLWYTAYQYIYDANACIEGINSAKNISPSARNSLLGEAKLIRSFLYFNLVNLYGSVPLVTGTDYHINSTIPRTSIEKIYTQLANDLVYTQSVLSKNKGANTRGNYYAATALLAKIYLYEGQYANAITESDKIISSGKYTLVPDLNSVFLAGSTETIWSFAPVQPGKQTAEGYFFVPTASGVIPTYIIANNLYNSFESGDLRKSDWIGTDTVSNQVYGYPFKYKLGVTSATSSENYVVFRLAEQYLIGAEAKANSNDITGALAELNIIRNRAGLPNFTNTDKQTIISAILSERQHELFCEWGNRWYDLKRLNIANNILSSQKSNWKSTSIFFPIPEAEITANPDLKQNPGY